MSLHSREQNKSVSHLPTTSFITNPQIQKSPVQLRTGLSNNRYRKTDLNRTNFETGFLIPHVNQFNHAGISLSITSNFIQTSQGFE